MLQRRQASQSREPAGKAPPVPADRVSRRQLATRAKLLQAAYEIMSSGGVDAAKIQDITERADVGFGTFYNYFASKDDLAGRVLDCVLDDLGRRNDLATASFKAGDPGRVMPVSVRLVLREASRAPMWRWWVLRPDLLAERMRQGFRPFGIRDLRQASAARVYHLDAIDLETAWTLSVWMMVGGLHEILVGRASSASEQLIVEAIVRVMGVNEALAHKLASGRLPPYPPSSINFRFWLEPAARAPQ
jgi:AcrR family transcriptional regulator